MSIRLTVSVSGFWYTPNLSHCSVYNMFRFIFLIYNLTTSVIHLLCFDQKGASLVGQVYSRHVSLKGFYYIYVCIRHLSSFSSQYHFSLCTSVCLLILIFTVDTQFHAIISFSCKIHEILVLHKFIILQFIFNLYYNLLKKYLFFHLFDLALFFF